MHNNKNNFKLIIFAKNDFINSILELKEFFKFDISTAKNNDFNLDDILMIHEDVINENDVKNVISNSKNILIWDTFTTEKNLQVSIDESFGMYKLSCKLQWDITDNSLYPCAGSVQIDKCETLSVIKRNYFPVYMRSFYINDLETNIKLLYNKLHELREDPKISC